MEATESVVLILKALADPVRLSILEFLWDPASDDFRTEEGICAGDIEDFLGVSQPTVSYHMKILVQAGLVIAQKRGQRVYYECVTEGLDELVQYLERYRQPTTASLFGP
jgi:ArsR family transcriptional regulator